MSEEYYSEAETQRLRDANPLPPACSYCKAEPSYEDDVLPHVRHLEGCVVGQRIRDLIEESSTTS